MTSFVLPLNIYFEEWASQIRIDVPNITFPLPSEVKFWRDWACQVVNTNKLQNVPLPTNITYPKDEDWKKWAAFFINNLYTQLN